jgi:hypothetical protein
MLTRNPSTSADRSISPPIARSRQHRKLPSNAADSSRDNPRGNRRGSRTRSCDRDFGLATCASSPERRPDFDLHRRFRRNAGSVKSVFDRRQANRL